MLERLEGSASKRAFVDMDGLHNSEFDREQRKAWKERSTITPSLVAVHIFHLEEERGVQAFYLTYHWTAIHWRHFDTVNGPLIVFLHECREFGMGSVMIQVAS